VVNDGGTNRRHRSTKETPMDQGVENQTAGKRKPGTPGALSRWMQRTMNARMNRKVRGGNGKFMGMDVLILTTVGRRSGQPRETPVAWFADGPDAWLVVASGGGSRHPDWHVNLMAHPDRASIELPGRDAMPVTPHRLDGADREQAWQRIAAAQPRIAKYQSRSDREYPVVRLTHR
jgi:deazaflavin-dependent oxidoreductase (nitroreductase family)